MDNSVSFFVFLHLLRPLLNSELDGLRLFISLTSPWIFALYWPRVIELLASSNSVASKNLADPLQVEKVREISVAIRRHLDVFQFQIALLKCVFGLHNERLNHDKRGHIVGIAWPQHLCNLQGSLRLTARYYTLNDACTRSDFGYKLPVSFVKLKMLLPFGATLFRPSLHRTPSRSNTYHINQVYQFCIDPTKERAYSKDRAFEILMREKNRHASQLTKSELQDLLLEHHIPLSSWGIGEAKTLADLYSEIRHGESQLIVEKNGTLVREVGIVKIDIFYKDEVGTYRLAEDYQEFYDGRRRNFKQDCPVGEKMKPNETPIQAFERALREELAITRPIPGRATKTRITTKISKSYPGLLSRYHEHRFTVTIPKKYYNADGYMETDGDRKTYFSWRGVKTSRRS